MVDNDDFYRACQEIDSGHLNTNKEQLVALLEVCSNSNTGLRGVVSGAAC